MNLRRDPVQAAAHLVGELREAAVAAGGLATVGVLRAVPGAATVVPAEAHLTVDLRHHDLDVLEGIDSGAEALAGRSSRAEGCEFERVRVWETDPVRFDADLVARAQALAAADRTLTSGALHDAAAVSRAGVPAVMVFVRTLGGVSHSREEDAREEDLVAGIEAFAALVRELAQVSG
jgi:acetylornithine deacetylase/succinyl-diaminopimelate desuccinylase-like protein